MSGGEFDLIRTLAGALGRRRDDVAIGIGDDAAVLGDGLCVTCDLLVEDVHFRRSTTTPGDLGWKALAVSLSDLAAMGAEPILAVVGLGVPVAVEEPELVAIYAGLEECAAAYGLDVAGGDVVRAPALTLSVTALGRATTPALRSGARPGSVLAVTGPLGGSRAGLALLEGQATGDAALVERHRRPRPRIAEGSALAGIVQAQLDLSDGLASDAARLAEASGVACEIDLARVPVAAGVDDVARQLGRAPGWFATAGGEDYELLVAIAPDALEAAGVPLLVVGRVIDGPAGTVAFTGEGSDVPPSGYDHLDDRPS